MVKFGMCGGVEPLADLFAHPEPVVIMFLLVEADELLGEQLVLEPVRAIGVEALAEKAADGAQVARRQRGEDSLHTECLSVVIRRRISP